jgi:hypothetical protein
MKTSRFVFAIVLLAASAWSADQYALIIGVTGYPNFRDSDRLHFADHDAQSFAELLATGAAGQFLPANIHLLLNDHAKRVDIYHEMASIGSRASNADLVYVFFAGHGMLDSSGRAYFMPYDADPTDPGALGIRADTFFGDLKERITARQMIFFIDACHAAAGYSPSGSATRSAGNIIPGLQQFWQSQFAGLQELNMAFLSASSNELSLEDESLKHGVFTWYLLKGLKGDADPRQTGKVTAGALKRYLADRVEEYASHKSAHQTPTVSPTFDPDRVLAVYEVPLAARAAPSAENAPVMPTKMPPPAPALYYSPRARSRFLGRKGNTDTYDFDVWIEPRQRGQFERIVKVKYDFVHATNPLSMESDKPVDGFPVTYRGWGCYGSVKLTFTLKDPAETAQQQPFDMCALLVPRK